MRVVNMAQPAEIVNLSLTPYVLQVPASLQSLARRAVAAASLVHLLLDLVKGSLAIRRLSRDGTPDENNTEFFGVNKDRTLRNAAGSGEY